MNKKYADEMFERFTLYFPTIAKKTVQYKADTVGSLIVDLDDGTSVLWDDDYTSFRNLPPKGLDTSEYQFRREFSHRLRKLLIQKNMTQAELADITGLQRTQINNYINCKNTPSWYVIDKIAKALRCSTDELRYID